MRESRTFEIVDCYDCGWVGNRPEEAPGDTGWTIPPIEWTELLCPECAASCGNWFTVCEVVEAECG